MDLMRALRFPHYELDALAHGIPLSSAGLLELRPVFGCGSLHLILSVTGERLYDEKQLHEVLRRRRVETIDIKGY
ncbi:hypothetical protein STEG23_028967 [Scotinomys teguina]